MLTTAQLHWAHKANALQLAGLNDLARAVSNLFVTGPIAAERRSLQNPEKAHRMTVLR